MGTNLLTIVNVTALSPVTCHLSPGSHKHPSTSRYTSAAFPQISHIFPIKRVVLSLKCIYNPYQVPIPSKGRPGIVHGQGGVSTQIESGGDTDGTAALVPSGV